MRNSVSDVTDAEILDEAREAMTQAAFDAAKHEGQAGKGPALPQRGERRAGRELVPIYTRYRELGGRYVTLGSDAHTSDAVAVNFGAAEELAAMVGLGLVTFAERRMVPCTK